MEKQLNIAMVSVHWAQYPWLYKQLPCVPILTMENIEET